MLPGKCWRLLKVLNETHRLLLVGSTVR